MSSSAATSAGAPSAAPGELEFVRAFVNSRDIEADTDGFADIRSWRAWADAHGVSGTTTVAELDRARALREALRTGMLANHDRAPMPVTTASALTEAADRGGVALRFDPDAARLVGTGSGLNGAVARVVAAVAAAVNDGTWSRLKACANDSCRWGFYDRSRSRTGQWCSMGVCGNRAKQARFREAARG